MKSQNEIQNTDQNNAKKIQLVIPMSGQGVRFQKAGYSAPKPLIPVSGTPMIERLLSCFPQSWPSTFIAAENHRATELPQVLNRLRPDARISYIPPHNQGPGQALLEALKLLPPDSPVFVSYCDYGMVWDPAQFERFVRETDCDACLISYRGFHAHYLNPQTYAYSRLEGERVVEVREKGSFTSNREQEFASAGGYYFKTAELLKKALEHQLKSDLVLNGESYTSLTVQALLLLDPKAHVRVFEIPYFFQWGTPEDLRNFEYWERSWKAWNRQVGSQAQLDQLLIPMAGLGSRFSDITSLPKPLIPVGNRPMFQRAIESFPNSKRTILVTLDSIADQIQSQFQRQGQIVRLEKTPPGQALSTEAGLDSLDPKQEVVVTACDHAIALSSDKWDRFRHLKNCDAAIFTFRPYPPALKTPRSYAYVIPMAEPNPEKLDTEFPPVKQVSVKVPVSADPSKDYVLVGSFWFRTAEILSQGIQELKKRDLRVNQELYLDSVFECLKDMGFHIRMVELEGYLCWGDPATLSEALYWQEVFVGQKTAQRPKFPGIESYA